MQENNIIKDTTIYDLIGLGAGPFNLSVAALSDSLDMKTLFLEKKDKCHWHPGMKIPSAKIQNSHLRDLVSLADPTNKYSFTNFLHKTGRLEVHLIANFSNIIREEFEQYLQWVSDELESIKYSHLIEMVCEHKHGFEIFVKNNLTKVIHSFITKNIIVGTGIHFNIPTFALKSLNENIFHNGEYLFRKEGIKGKRITIIGAGQSGLEVMLDIINSSIEVSEIVLIDRKPYVMQIEDSQFAEDVVFSIKGVDNVFNMNRIQKEQALEDFRFTSDGASPETIESLYQAIYINKLMNKDSIDISILHNSSADSLIVNDNNSVTLSINNKVSNNTLSHNTDIVILATGYKQSFPINLLDTKITSKIHFDNKYRPEINSEYSVKYDGKGNIYVVNGAKHTHGVVDSNLSLSAIRAARIINSHLKKEIFRISSEQIYKDFSQTRRSVINGEDNMNNYNKGKFI